jgi:cytochrome b561
MVLLHTSWKFNGLAGATTLLTIIIVISGFIGRYIYTRVPRSLAGLDITDPGAQGQAAALVRTRRMLSTWYAIHIPIGVALFAAAFIHNGAALYYATLLR